MIKKILLPVFLLFSLVTLAQQATSSPYSFYGIGDIRFRGTVENRLMGGVSVFPDSIHMNLQNPGSYAGLKLSTFAVGAGYNAVKLHSYQGDDKAQRTTVDYMAIGMPILKKSSVAFGIIPYSAVGYKVSNVDIAGTTRRFQGKGGLNKVFVGYGYEISKHLSVGADLAYNFGSIKTDNVKYLSDVQYGTEELNESDMSGFNVKVGAIYQRKINKHDFFASLSFTPQSSLRSRNTRNVYTVQYAEEGASPMIVDRLEIDTTQFNNTVKLPMQFSIGAGFGTPKKWLVGTEIVFKQSNSLSNRFKDVSQATFENGFVYSIGGYYIPNYSAFSGYFKKVTYRAGFRYEKTGMVIRNESIMDQAVTGGFGFPLGGLFSNINLGVEYGKKGTAARANLVQEKYTNVIMSFSLNDKWFVQRKFD